jgi:5'-nucleotidase
MRILISNDDGIYSPGIFALAEVAAELGDVRIVAPDVEQSSMGHAITASRPLTYKRTPRGDFEAFRVNGTPADCVALGAYHWKDVDVVLSGINLGVNLGNSTWHSGRSPRPSRQCSWECGGLPSAPPRTERSPTSRR